ncbi:hypothetical protein ACFQZQ_11020 [Lysobacter koreensis]|uniref:Uncharacterized protein n=1 Tax=Lysobacter koreensis TaxID=266122 RepID=A0ABW2YRD4_9GAMM
MPKPTTKAQTVAPQNSVVRAALKPDSELEIIIGGPYTRQGVEHKYGHTALRIKTPRTEHTYDFGRYGRIYPESLGFGIDLDGEDSPRGEGILNIWANFGAYIASENQTGRTSWGYQYAIFEAQANRTIAYFDKMIAGSNPLKTTASYKRYKISTDYFALGPNCTTLSIDGAKQAIPRVVEGSEKHIRPEDVLSTLVSTAMKAKYGTPKRLFLPANLRTYYGSNDVRIRVDKRKTYQAGAR